MARRDTKNIVAAGAGSPEETAVYTPLVNAAQTSPQKFQDLTIIIIVLNIYYSPLLWLTTLILLIYKGYVFPYATFAYPLEVFVLFPWACIEASRIFFGIRGNKMEDLTSTAIFMGLTLVSCITHLFFMLWQSYILFFDVLLNAIGLVFILGELITGGILISNLVNNQH